MRDLFLFEDEDGQKIVLDDDVIAGGRAFEKEVEKKGETWRCFYLTIYGCIGMGKVEWVLRYKNAEVRDQAFAYLRERLAAVSGLYVWGDDEEDDEEGQNGRMG